MQQMWTFYFTASLPFLKKLVEFIVLVLYMYSGLKFCFFFLLDVLLKIIYSVVVALGLRCGARASRCGGSSEWSTGSRPAGSVVAHRLICPAACGILVSQLGIKPTCRIGRQILNLWNTREVHIRVSWMCQSPQSYGTVGIILLILQIRKLSTENKKAVQYHTVSD